MTTSKRRNPFAQPADPWNGANDPLATIRMPEKKKRERKWEKENRAYTYGVSAQSNEAAHLIRDAILWISQHNENGELRQDRTTVDNVATVLIDYALQLAEKENLVFAPTRTGRMTIQWEEVEQGWESPIKIGTPIRKKKTPPKKTVFLAYRWPKKYHQRIEALSGKVPDTKKQNPHRYKVPIGEVVVRLLQRGIDDYKARKIHLTSSQESVTQKVAGWAK